MKHSYFTVSKFASIAIVIILAASLGHAQSKDQNFPTPITSNELNGALQARDIGDSRLTTYYYAFDGRQGDIFINVITKNFSGDLDIFIQEGLRSLTKIVVYADSSGSETGRLIYLRKEERLLLRIQGRTPNDDPALFRIKFGGSFVALRQQKQVDAPSTDSQLAGNNARTVNSVGTKIEIVPPPAPISSKAVINAQEAGPINESKSDEIEVSSAAPKKIDLVLKKMPEPAQAEPSRTTSRIASSKVKAAVTPPVKREEAKLDPLASIRLIIQLKDGTSIERPMTEVSKFSVDKGVLTVINKKGAVSKFSILDVTRVTIE